MKRFGIVIAAAMVGISAYLQLEQMAFAQPARGAPAAVERVRDEIVNRFKGLKLTGDPDKDFSELLSAFYEEQLFLSKTQLEYGGDRQLREMAQRLQNEQETRLDELKQWKARSQVSDYRAQPDQPPPGSGPLDRRGAQAAAQPSSPQSPKAEPSTTAAAAPAAAPTVSATVEDVNASAGKVTLDHGPIPNLGMDAMTMVFKAADATMLKGLKKGDKVRFAADRVNGQLTVTKIQKGR